MNTPVGTASARMLRHPQVDTYCTSARYVRYSDAGTRKGTRVCRYCGSTLHPVVVTFAVVQWRGDGRYSLSDAVRTFTRDEAAETFARSYSDSHVVRSFELDQ